MNKLELQRDLLIEMKSLHSFLTDLIVKRSEYVLYEIVKEVCQHSHQSECDGKLITSLTRFGINFPVCQGHYAEAMRDERVHHKAESEKT